METFLLPAVKPKLIYSNWQWHVRPYTTTNIAIIINVNANEREWETEKVERESACMLEREEGGKDRKERENRMKEWILSETDKEWERER